MDLFTQDPTGEVEPLVKLGATRVDWQYPPDADYVVLADSDGNTFCVVRFKAAPGEPCPDFLVDSGQRKS